MSHSVYFLKLPDSCWASWNAQIARQFHLHFKNFFSFFSLINPQITPNHLQNNIVLSNLKRWAQRANLVIVKKSLQLKKIKPCLRRPGQSMMLLTLEGLEFGVFLITHWKILGFPLRETFPHCTEIKVLSLTFLSIHFLIFLLSPQKPHALPLTALTCLYPNPI